MTTEFPYKDTLSYDEAMQIVNDMLLVCQKLKSNLDESLGVTLGAYVEHYAATSKGKADLERDQELIRNDLYSWVSGKKDITPLLIDISLGLKPMTGMGIYNLMVICHRLMPVLAAFAPLRTPDGRELPEPKNTWALQGAIIKEG